MNVLLRLKFLFFIYLFFFIMVVYVLEKLCQIS